MKKFKVVVLILVGILTFGNQLFSQNDLVGSYYYHGNEEIPMPNIDIELFDINNALIASTATDASGQFLLEGIPDGEYYLSPSTTLEAGGIDLYDALLVFYNISGWYELNEMQKEVADVDNDGVVSYADFVSIMVNYLLLGQSFPAGDWVFDDVEINFSSRSSSNDTISTWATSTGDVEGVWIPSGRDIAYLNNSYYESQSSEQNSTYSIKSDYNGIVNGFNLNLAYASDEINILSINGPDENFTYSIDDVNGEIKVAWLNENRGSSIVNGDDLFEVEVEYLNEIENSVKEIFTLLPEGTVLDYENNKMGDIEIKLPLLQNKQTVNVTVDAYPNPVVNMLNFNIQLNKQDQASLSVYNLNGKLVSYTENIVLHKGEQTVSFSVVDLVPGNYVYSFSLYGDSAKNIKGRFVKSK